ncbi:MAG: hypothetical protein F4029_03895 [Gammaproteobacteria bacterium]|nr:hypothetical protein [Gammaproteobacteria bacterium]MYK45352.1 hypothetical protein [Gammaproteobacteria bacterium]
MTDVSSPLAEQASAYYNDLLRPLFADRKFLIAGPIAVGLGGLARRLNGLGAQRPFLIAGSEGTGALPSPEEAELHVLGLDSKDILEEHRDLEQVIDDLPGELRRAIDAWDPTGSASFIFSSPLAASRTVAPRRPYGARPAAWAALEDKVQIDAFWDAAGIARAPSRIVPADYDAITTAAEALDRGLGTVWAADARDGTHGGGLGLRWVRPGDDGRTSYASLRRMADRVRVMPFLEGIPASIHGIVFPDAVTVFRPVEMVVLRPADGDRLFYAGCATAFDPNPDDRASMRDAAYRAGKALRDDVGYRGPFGIDGILGEDGYVPTEMNARFGAGLAPLAAGLPDLPLAPLCLAIIHGEQLDYRPDLFERAVVESADTHRTCAGWSVTRTTFDESGVLEVVRDGDEYRRSRSGEESHGTLQFGPSVMGGFVRFVLHATRIKRGSSTAPEVVRALRLADRALGTDFGELHAAKNLRP